VLTRYVDIVRIEKSAGTQFRHEFRKAGARDREAAFAATGHAEMVNHLFADVPGAMHDNPTGEGVVIGRFQSCKPNRLAVGSDIGGTRSIGPCRARVRPVLIGETLQPPGAQGVGTASMRDQMRAYATVGEIHQVEPWRSRRQGEIRDSDKISVADAVAVPIQRMQRAPKQGRRHLVPDTVRSPRSTPSDCRAASQTGQRDPKEKTTGKGQDAKFLFRQPLVGAYAPS
jgi:hypothetical protein